MSALNPIVAPDRTGVTTALIGVGNEYRSDDALGFLAVREIASKKFRGVKVVEANGDGVSVMRLWQGVDRVFIIDAMKLGFPPGTIHRIDASNNEIPVSFFTFSSHAFGLGQAIEMARQLGQLPPSLVVYGMEGVCFDFGTELSVSLRENLPVLIKMISSELYSWKE